MGSSPWRPGCALPMAVLGLYRIPYQGTLRSALTTLHGVSHAKANALCDALGLRRNMQVTEASPRVLSQLFAMIDKRKDVEANLRKREDDRAQMLYDIGTVRGWRRVNGYPVRGQRTKTNAQTARKMPTPGSYGGGRAGFAAMAVLSK